MMPDLAICQIQAVAETKFFNCTKFMLISLLFHHHNNFRSPYFNVVYKTFSYYPIIPFIDARNNYHELLRKT